MLRVEDCSGVFKWGPVAELGEDWTIETPTEVITGSTTGGNITYSPVTISPVTITDDVIISTKGFSTYDINTIDLGTAHTPWTFEFRYPETITPIVDLDIMTADRDWADRKDADANEYNSSEELSASEELLAALDEYSKGNNSDGEEKEG